MLYSKEKVFRPCVPIASSSSNVKNFFEIQRFEGTGFDLWNARNSLFLKDCDKALVAEKPEKMSEDTCLILNNKAVTYIKMAVSNDILVDLQGVASEI